MSYSLCYFSVYSFAPVLRAEANSSLRSRGVRALLEAVLASSATYSLLSTPHVYRDPVNSDLLVELLVEVEHFFTRHCLELGCGRLMVRIAAGWLVKM